MRVIFEGDACERCFVRDEYFVLRHLSEADDRWAIDIELADAAVALGDDDAAGSGVAEGAARTRLTVSSRALNFCSPAMVP